MHVLLTNDDGIDAPGLEVLYESVTRLGVERVTIAAPAEHLSGCSHQATTDRHIKVEAVTEAHYAVHGTPVDCVRIALQSCRPDWVISGVNDGGNLGVDVFMSGTVAAAREATLHGLNAIALSQYRKQREPLWGRTRQWTERVLAVLLEQSTDGFLWNINYPDVSVTHEPRLVAAPVDVLPLPNDFEENGNSYRYRGSYHHRPRAADSDVAACFAGNVSISAVSVTSAPVDLPSNLFD